MVLKFEDDSLEEVRHLHCVAKVALCCVPHTCMRWRQPSVRCMQAYGLYQSTSAFPTDLLFSALGSLVSGGLPLGHVC